MERIAIIAFTKKGCMLARRLADKLGARLAYADAAFSVSGPARFAEETGVEAYRSLTSWTSAHFAQDDALIFVGASGIAVRAIAPHVRDKFTDPAVVSVDEAGLFAVSLLSGHVGGANELARAVAAATGGQAAVSTATDVNGLFAVDEWAARHDFAIVERRVAKLISAALLEGRPVGFKSDFAIDDAPTCLGGGDVPEVAASAGENADEAGEACVIGDVPSVVGLAGDDESGSAGGVAASVGGLAAAATAPEVAAGAMPEPAATSPGPATTASESAATAPEPAAGAAPEPPDLGFVVSLDDTAKPFAQTLHLVPRVVTLGVGCRRGTDSAVFERAVLDVLATARISTRAVTTIASIDVKKDEQAIHDLAAKMGWQTVFYTADQLMEVPGEFASSDFVKRTVGVDNVCERAACANGGTLLIGKQAGDGVTVAVAATWPCNAQCKQQPERKQQPECKEQPG